MSLLVLMIASWYALGLFGSLSSGDTSFQASDSQSAVADEKIEEIFGTVPSNQLVLFERKDTSLGDAKSDAYQAEVARILRPLRMKADTVTTYADTRADSLISADGTKMLTLVTVDGDNDAVFETMHTFWQQADKTKLSVSIGGDIVGQQQTTETVEEDLARAEAITVPVLLVLLVLFFRSGVAALVPVSMSLVTIIGAFAVARLATHFISIDSYAVNVITILGIGLSIDYALLSVNRFREELKTHSVEEAVRVVIATSGHTIFFSGFTVIASLLALLVFPIEFLHSIAIGGASAVLVAMAFTIIVLPAVLRLLGTRIDSWHLPIRFFKTSSDDTGVWWRIARVTTRHPIIMLSIGVVVVAAALIPVFQFKTAGNMDHNWLARGSSAQYVGDVLERDFPRSTSSTSVLLTLPGDTSDAERADVSCALTRELQNVDGVSSVMSPTPVSGELSCGVLKQMIAAGRVPEELQQLRERLVEGDAMQYDVTLANKVGTDEANATVQALRKVNPQKGAIQVGGAAAQIYDTDQAYRTGIPLALTIVVIVMLLLLTFSLRAVILPIQAVIINTISLGISLAIVVGIFQMGWFHELTGWRTSDGLVLSAPVLVVAIAFGLAMDYSVFLYSRMREIYDRSGDAVGAVQQAVAKTGPIITAAALAFFVVVVAFASSSVMFMQIIGVGLGAAVLVDAFFVRLVLVPSVMVLLRKISWI